MSVSQLEYNFINISEPNDAKAVSHRLAVRSQASQAQWQKASTKRVTQHQKRLKHKKNRQPLTFVFELDNRVTSEENNASSESSCIETVPRPSDSPPILRILGGGRVDPFRSYPVAWRPFLPRVVDHCTNYPIFCSIPCPMLSYFPHTSSPDPCTHDAFSAPSLLYLVS